MFCDKVYYKCNMISRKTETSYIKFIPSTWEEKVTIWLASPVFLLTWFVQCWPRSKEPKSIDSIASCERNWREALEWRWNREGRCRRIQGKCDERADEWTDDELGRLACSHADARYHTDCYARFFSGRSLSGNTSKESSHDIARSPLELLMKDMQRQRSQRWFCVWLMERYVELDWEAYAAFHNNQLDLW